MSTTTLFDGDACRQLLMSPARRESCSRVRFGPTPRAIVARCSVESKGGSSPCSLRCAWLRSRFAPLTRPALLRNPERRSAPRNSLFSLTKECLSEMLFSAKCQQPDASSTEFARMSTAQEVSSLSVAPSVCRRTPRRRANGVIFAHRLCFRARRVCRRVAAVWSAKRTSTACNTASRWSLLSPDHRRGNFAGWRMFS